MSAIAALMFAASTPTAADRAALDAATRAIYAPYYREDHFDPVWERDIWSREVLALIAQWQAVIPESEPDALNDGDWLCQCQDWDPHAFRMDIKSYKRVSSRVAEVAVDITLFANTDPRDAYLVFRKEKGRWRLDEMYTEEHADGIKAALRETIIADRKLRQ